MVRLVIFIVALCTADVICGVVVDTQLVCDLSRQMII